MESLKLMWDSLPYLLVGAVTTLEISGIAVLIGILLGTLVGLGRVSGPRWLAALLTAYVEVLRGTPLLTQLLLVVLGLPQVLHVQFDPFTAAVITIGINSSAYVGEIIRAGIQSIDKGQMEAARSLGMSRGQAMIYVILPQAFKQVIPPLVNEVVSLIKESSLVSAISLKELTRTAQLIGSRTFNLFPPLLGAALIYLALTLSLSRLAGVLERRLKVSD